MAVSPSARFFAAWIFNDLGHDIRDVRGPDGRYELVVVDGGSFNIDPTYAVRIRTGPGPLSRETTVWQGYEEGPAPTEVRFIGPRTVEVVTEERTYRSTFDGFTLRPSPKHVEKRPSDD